MANIQVRGTSLAIEVEVTEGTPVLPNAGTDFMPIQSDLAITPSFETLENDEMRASLGASKSIQGNEAPTANLSLYLKPSGTSGTAPNYGPKLLKAIFGAEDDAGVEHDTVASSTVSLVKVDTGEGATYIRGQGLLIQDPVNGYSLRAVHSISSDDLTLAFNLANAPGTGVLLGEAVTYYPANEGHQSLTLTRYLGVGGGIDVAAGMKVTQLDINFTSGQLINQTFTLEGTGYYANPIEITSSTRYLDFEDDGGDHAAVVAVGLYKDPYQLAEALEQAMNDVSTDEITVTYDRLTGKFTITADGAVFELKWQSGTNTANTIGTKIGFVVSADDTSALTYTSDNAQTYTATTPVFDSMDALVAKNMSVLLGDSTDSACFKAESVQVSIGLPIARIGSMCSESGVSGTIATERTVTAQVVAYAEKYDVDKFMRYRTNKDTRMQLGFGEKVGGNWAKGKCGILYMPTCVVSAYELAENNGLYAINFTLTAYVDNSGNGEVYISML